MITYWQIKDLVYHRLYQNSATERITDADMAFAINIAQYELCSKIVHPFLLWNINKDLGDWNKWKEFTFDFDIKKIYKVLWHANSADINWTELIRVNDTPVVLKNQYKFNLNWITTGDEFQKVAIFCERLLPNIENDTTNWTKQFILWDYYGGIIAERIMQMLVPINLAEWYNISQYHWAVVADMIKSSAALCWNFLDSSIKNQVI